MLPDRRAACRWRAFACLPARALMCNPSACSLRAGSSPCSHKRVRRRRAILFLSAHKHIHCWRIEVFFVGAQACSGVGAQECSLLAHKRVHRPRGRVFLAGKLSVVGAQVCSVSVCQFLPSTSPLVCKGIQPLTVSDATGSAGTNFWASLCWLYPGPVLLCPEIPPCWFPFDIPFKL